MPLSLRFGLGLTASGGVSASASAFVFEVDTTATSTGSSASDTFVFPTVSTGTYDCNVDWGDGSSDDITTHDDAAWSHTYSSGGTYTVTITGTVSGIRFNNTGDRLKIGEVSDWGQLTLIAGLSGDEFYGCSNLSCTGAALSSAPILAAGVSDFSSMFRSASSFNADLSSWDVSAGTNFFGMFYNASSFNADLSSWDVSAGTNFSGMFFNASSFNADLSSWDVSAGTNFFEMFRGASSFNADLSSWDVSAGTNFTNFMLGVTLSTANYDALLIGWEALDLVDSLSVHFGNSTYTSGGAAEAARSAIIADDSWTITDGGPA